MPDRKEECLPDIHAVTIDDAGLPVPTAEIRQEREVAMFDLMEQNRFRLIDKEGGEIAGPFDLHLAIREPRLVMEMSDSESGAHLAAFHLSLSPLRQVIKDYFQICAAYFDAVKRLPPAQIEAIDMGRRGIHDEGGRLVIERLEGKATLDMPTARRLFTLICVLHFKG